MTGDMTLLDDIRAEIVERRDRAMDAVARAQRTVDCMVAELEAHDRAVAAMPTGVAAMPTGAAATPPIKPPRAARRDIAELVYAALTDRPQTIREIAKATGMYSSLVKAALERLGSRGFSADGNCWTRAGA